MTLTKTDTTESQFRMSVAAAGVRRVLATLLSVLLVGCGGDGSDSAADTAAPQAAPLQEQILVFTQAGPLNLVVGDTLSNVASGGLGTGVISYRSSDTTVATVDATGRLTVVGAGIAMITAEKAADTQYAAASADYDVSATPLPQDPGPEPQSIGFAQPGPFSLVVGGTLSNVASGGSGTGVIRYSSSDTTIATVDAAGQLTVVGAGIAMITAEKAADANYTAASASYLVQTTPASQAIGFDQPGPLYLMVGDTLRNEASGGSGTGVISYSSSNTTVATVDAAGELTVVGIGTAEITAEKAADANYMAASASYTVTAPSRVSVTAWVGRENAEVQVDLPLSTSGMQFFRSNEANCDLSNVHSCANGQSNIVHGDETVEDTAFTLNQTAYYVLQHGANQASLEVSTEVARTGPRFSPRTSHQVVVHNNRLWVIGGRAFVDGALVRYNDVWWSQDGVNWEATDNSTRRFSAREGHQVVVYDGKLWVIGGWDGSNRKNDVWWSQDGVTWTEVEKAPNSEKFSARDGHQVVVHDGELWLIGGSDVRGRKNDVWRSEDGGKWEKVLPTSTSPTDLRFSVRTNHRVVSHNDLLWVIGGDACAVDANGACAVDGANNIRYVRANDVWWSEDGATWIEATKNAPARFSGRHHHKVVSHNDLLWVIGGTHDAIRSKNDVWWSEDGKTWTEATNNADFSRRTSHQVVVHNNRLWVIGGNADDGSGRKNDVWRSEDGVNWRLGFNDVFQFQ